MKSIIHRIGKKEYWRSYLYAAIVITVVTYLAEVIPHLQSLSITVFREASSVAMVSILGWILLIPVFIYLVKRFNLFRSNRFRSVPVHIFAGLFLTLIHYGLFWGIHRSLWPTCELQVDPMSTTQILGSFDSSLFGYWLSVSILSSLFYVRYSKKNNDNSDEKPEFFMVEKLGNMIHLPVEDIIWIKAAGNYAVLGSEEDQYVYRITQKELESNLDPQKFLRVHRSHTINRDFVRNVRKGKSGEYQFMMSDGELIHSSRSYKQDIAAQLWKREN